MLKRLFLSRSKEILNQVESAENILKSAQERIDKLNEGNEFHLLRDELLRLIRDSHFISMQMGQGGIDSYSQKLKEQDKLVKQINECLNEMENMLTTKKEPGNEREKTQ